MADVQKDPSIENVEKLMSAITRLNSATITFQNSLRDLADVLYVPSPKAIHNYLMGKLNDDYDNYELDRIDAAYDLNQAERRIAVLESKTKRDENGKENIANLRASSKGLEDAMKDIFDGKAVDEGLLTELIAKLKI